jgi:hypothetical protein
MSFNSVYAVTLHFDCRIKMQQFQLGTRKQRKITPGIISTEHNLTQRISNDKTMTTTASNMLISYLLFSLFGAMNQRAVTTLAAVSAQCKADVDLLRNNTQLLAAFPTGGCDIDLSSARSCTFDFATVSADLERLCSDAGGQFQVHYVTSDCKVTVSGKRYNADYFFLNYPGCFGASCDASEVEDSFENEVFPAIKREFATLGLQCQVSASHPIGLHFFAVVVSTVSVFVSFM